MKSEKTNWRQIIYYLMGGLLCLTIVFSPIGIIILELADVIEGLNK